MGSIFSFIVNHAELVGSAVAWLVGQVVVANTNNPRARRAATAAGRLAQAALQTVGRVSVVKHANTPGSALKMPFTDAGTGRLSSAIAPLDDGPGE